MYCGYARFSILGDRDVLPSIRINVRVGFGVGSRDDFPVISRFVSDFSLNR
jgi:hypothetical protein